MRMGGGGGMEKSFQNNWSTGFFDCCSDCAIGAQSCFCPCVSYGLLREREGSRSGCVGPGFLYCVLLPLGLSWVMGWNNRTALRTKRKIVGNSNLDCLAHFFCPCCALAQETVELQLRSKGDWNVSGSMSGGVVSPSRAFGNYNEIVF